MFLLSFWPFLSCTLLLHTTLCYSSPWDGSTRWRLWRRFCAVKTRAAQSSMRRSIAVRWLKLLSSVTVLWPSRGSTPPLIARFDQVSRTTLDPRFAVFSVRLSFLAPRDTSFLCRLSKYAPWHRPISHHTLLYRFFSYFTLDCLVDSALSLLPTVSLSDICSPSDVVLSGNQTSVEAIATLVYARL